MKPLNIKGAMCLLSAIVPIIPAGCAPYMQAKLDLIAQSRRGIELVNNAQDERQKLLDQLINLRRAQLDDAFDADVRQRKSISADWAIEARKAYAAGLAMIEQERASSLSAWQTTRQNLTEIDRALYQLEMLQSLESRFIPEVKR